MTAFKAVKVTENVWWVGAIDWHLREFHGYRTSRGSTYNAFLVIDEKITLIDTVKEQFFDSERIKSKIVEILYLTEIVEKSRKSKP